MISRWLIAWLPPRRRYGRPNFQASAQLSYALQRRSWLIRGAGSTRLKANLERASTHAILERATAAPYLTLAPILPTDIRGKEEQVRRKPVGVVSMISPGNWPLHLSTRSVAPALAVGNAVVVKPASDTPVTGGSSRKNFRREVCRQASSASSLAPAAKSARPLSHPSVPRVISFTGSTDKAEIIKRVDLALGANGPVVVLEDADLEAAVEVALFGKFLHQGQICIAVNRLIVDDHVHDRFLKLFVERVRSLKIGDPNEPDTCIEPIINVSQLNPLIERIRGAPQAGVRQVVGGEPQGLVLPPHVFSDVINNRDLARDVLFGPVTPIIRARGDDEALRLANATQYGLRGAVFTGEAERGRRFAQRLKVGMAHVNDQSAVDLPNSPFGREKNSGIGRFNDTWAIEAFALLESKAAHAHH